jgi:hypothetical protein
MKLLRIATAALALALVAPAPAYAEVTSVDDAVGDLAHGTDIVRVTLKHAARVRVRVKHVNLRRHPKRGAGISVYVDVDRQRPGPEYVLGGGLQDGTDYLLGTADRWDFGTAVQCRYRMTLDYSDELTRIWFRRGCFARPDAVRVAVEVGAEAPGGTGETITDWMDHRRAFTPWVAQG